MANKTNKGSRKKPTASSTIAEIKAYTKWALTQKRQKEKAKRDEKRRKEALKRARSIKF